jgi:hypothetical protein
MHQVYRHDQLAKDGFGKETTTRPRMKNSQFSILNFEFPRPTQKAEAGLSFKIQN